MLYFATTNARKIAEARSILDPAGITIEPAAISADEIQHRDPAMIAVAKARAAYEELRAPVVVSDTSWGIPALNGFPGGYMKDVSAWFTAQDWLRLMDGQTDRRIICYEYIAYCNGATVEHFVSEYEGRLIDTPRGRVDDEESIEQVTIMYGDQTMAELLAAGKIASAGEEMTHWQLFAGWYNSRR